MPTLIERLPIPPARRPMGASSRASRLFHFDPLLGETSPEAHKRKRRLVALSVVAHVVLAIVVVLLPPVERTVAEPSLPISIVLTEPPPPMEEPHLPPPPPPQAKPAPKPEAPKPVPKVEAPPEAPEPPPVAKAPEPPPEPAPAPKPAAPKPVVRTGLLGEINDAPPVVAGKTGRVVVAAATGFESGPGKSGGAPADRKLVASAFDDGAGTTPARRASGTGTVRATGFDDAKAPAAAVAKPKAPAAEAPDVAVEIVSKPKPVYTEEARALKIEGDVVLEVTFTATGRVQVIRVVQGLGHGLDEAAIEAAKKLQFTPARRNGQAVDHTASLRVVFRLA